MNKNIKNVQTMIGLDVIIDGSVELDNGIIVYGKIKRLRFSALFGHILFRAFFRPAEWQKSLPKAYPPKIFA